MANAANTDKSWADIVDAYRQEEEIRIALRYVKKTKYKLDVDAFEQELKGYLIFSSRKKADTRRIAPETLETALDILHECEHYKDRVGTMWLETRRLYAKMEDFYNACSAYLLTKNDIQGLRSETMRQAVVDDILAKLNRRMNQLKNFLDMCEYVSKSLYHTYQHIYLQIDIVKIMVYRRPDPNRDVEETHSKTRSGIAKVHKKFSRTLD